MLPRRAAILGLAVLALPFGAEAKRKKSKSVVTEATSCGCLLTFAAYAADFTPGAEDVSVVTVSTAVTATLPSAASNAGRQLAIVAGAPGSANRITVNDDTNAFLLNGPGIVVCDGTRWYVASNF